MRVALLTAGAMLSWVAIAQAQSIDSTCKSGATEAPLIWYSSQDPARNDAAVAEFRKQYPAIKIESLRLATGPLATRYASERSAGVVNADVISLADPNFISSGQSKNWFVRLKKSELPSLSALDDRWFENGAATTSISMLGFAYNTDAVGSDIPKRWEDILDPKWKGRIILGDPRSIPSYMALFIILREKLGDEFLSKLAAQAPVVVPSVVPSTQQLAAGEIAIVIPNVMTVVRELKEQGAPINFMAPDLTTGNEFVTVMSEGSHSPNAAKCFYNFLFSQAGQVAYNGPTSVSPMGSLPGTAPMPSSYIAPQITSSPSQSPAVIKLLNLK